MDIRGSSGGQIAILEAGTGRMLGSAGAGQAPASVHPGAVYLHQGESYVVDSLDFEDGVAFVHAEDPGYTTFARELTDIAVTGEGERKTYGPVTVGLVPVSVTNTVIGYLRRRLTGEVIDFVELDMPTRTLETIAVMCTIEPETLQHNGIEPLRVPGSLHAAEHAAIGLLPLVASCDRGDIGGVSTAIGPVGRSADDLRLRRLSRRRGLRRSRLPQDRHLVGGDRGGDRGVRLPGWVPVVRAVAQMRQRERPARQTGSDQSAATGSERTRRHGGVTPRGGDRPLEQSPPRVHGRSSRRWKRLVTQLR